MTHPAALLRNTWHAYHHNMRAWLLLALPLLLIVGFMVVSNVLTYQDGEIRTLTFNNGMIVAGVLRLAAIAAMLAATVFLIRIFFNAAFISAHHALPGGKPNVKEAYIIGIKTFWPVLWVVVLRGLIVLGGLILLIVPGIIWALRYSLAAQVAVIEGKRGMSALRRSKDLTNGKLLETFINFGVVGAFIGYGFWLIAFVVAGILIVMGGIVSLALPTESFYDVYLIIGIITMFMETAVIWFAIPFLPIAATAIYRDYSN